MGPVLIVGMCPSNKPKLGHTQNASLRRLESWMDSLNIRHFSFINTFDYPGDPKMSNVDFERLNKLCSEYNNILALGGFVSKVLSKVGAEFYSLPHPSPLNRLLNNKEYEDCILKECKEYLI